MSAAPPLALGPRERLILALDEPSAEAALAWVDRLGDTVSFYKIGMELLASGDYFRVLDALAARGKKVFVDLKFFDIPATVAGVVRGLSQWPVTLATIHGWHPAMMEAAAAARSGPLHLLAVTVLTSIDAADLQAMGVDADPLRVVVQRARAAQAAGIDGVVCSALEAASVRAATGAPFAIVCPGIRPDGGGGDDQKRVAGVAAAFAAGADCIVVGRPIRQAADPAAAAEAMQQQILAALKNQ